MYVYIYRALLFFTFKVSKMIVPKDMLNIELSYVCDHIRALISSQIPAVDNIFKKSDHLLRSLSMCSEGTASQT